MVVFKCFYDVCVINTVKWLLTSSNSWTCGRVQQTIVACIKEVGCAYFGWYFSNVNMMFVRKCWIFRILLFKNCLVDL